VAERFPDPAVQKSGAVALALLDSDDQRLSDVELTMVQTAKQHHAQTLDRRQSVPGIGKILRVVLLDEMPDITRFPRVQACVSYGRLVTCAKQSAGKRDGTSGAKIGHAYLTWVCSEAAVLLLRNNPAGQTYLARVENHQGQGNALTVFAHKLARAVSSRLNRDTACDLPKCLNGSWSGAGEPTASRDDHGLRLACGALMISRRQGTRRST
jgi:transposase